MRLPFVAAALLLLGPACVCVAQSEVEPGVRLTSPIEIVVHTPEGAKAIPLHASAIASNAHTGSNLARGLVHSGQHNTIELAGEHAALALDSPAPAIYVHIDAESPTDQRPMYTLIRLKPGKDSRLVLNMTANTFGGGRKRKFDEVAVTKTDVEGSWLKIVPQAPLTPGEYGLMLLPADPNMFSDRVYDFSVAAK